VPGPGVAGLHIEYQGGHVGLATGTKGCRLAEFEVLWAASPDLELDPPRLPKPIRSDFCLYDESSYTFHMTLDALFPFADDHAIQAAVFAIEWKDPLSEKEFRELKTRIQIRLQDFSVFKPTKTMLVNVSSDGNNPVQSSSEDSGFAVEIPGGFAEPPKRIIQVAKEGCLIVVNNYTRWSKVKADVDGYYEQLLAVIGAKSRKLASVSLQYTDLFIWKTDPEQLAVRDLFRSGNPFLAPTVLDLKTLWHCHLGYFEPMEDNTLPERLNNINVSRVLHGDHHAFNILTSHRLVFTKWAEASNLSLIARINEAFHDANKKILRELLTDEVATKISLG
jgi:uncharacterized protein (TIGR04255 family)